MQPNDPASRGSTGTQHRTRCALTQIDTLAFINPTWFTRVNKAEQTLARLHNLILNAFHIGFVQLHALCKQNIYIDKRQWRKAASLVSRSQLLSTDWHAIVSKRLRQWFRNKTNPGESWTKLLWFDIRIDTWPCWRFLRPQKMQIRRWRASAFVSENVPGTVIKLGGGAHARVQTRVRVAAGRSRLPMRYRIWMKSYGTSTFGDRY